MKEAILDMDPFEYFQELKPEIKRDEAFMDSLRTYAFTDRLRLFGNDKVTPLGAGRHNIHFRIGKVGDVWLATKEYLEASSKVFLLLPILQPTFTIFSTRASFASAKTCSKFEAN
ncbi:MAG: hypothetical protein UR27_C0013G0018 [Candidatus Peregrinibacteria bacterium GW2011_GWA2_33_10]|nr:MAG: hypothetical protein UR27_C0013G0018 [Candidatus Peregrinibacteria bacterium GW2011_GWA2_33_10]